MSGYATKVRHDIARWMQAGLIDSATAAALSADVEANHRGVSLGAILSMMAAALFSAAILLVVASNWEAIPRLVRVGLLFALILAGYAGGALLKLRGNGGFAEAAWVLAAAAFGGSIALIGQMYHLSGDEKQAVLVWCAGTAFAAAALRSGPLTAGAVLLAAAWMMMHAAGGWWPQRQPPLAFLPIAAGLYALSFWTRSPPARHLALLSSILFVFLHYLRDESFLWPLLLAGVGVALFAFGHLRPAQARRFLGLGAGLPVQALVAFLTGIGIMQIALVDEPGFVIVSAAALAGIVAALLLAGRDNAFLRRLAYAAFVFQLAAIYEVMLGTMLGTAGFFLVGGAALAGLAWLITRLERRLAGPDAAAGGVS